MPSLKKFLRLKEELDLVEQRVHDMGERLVHLLNKPKEEIEDKGPCFDEPSGENEETPSEEEMLVVRRALSGLIDHDGDTQREEIFTTRCTIEGKVCSLVIDDGSCVNGVSKMVVDKLQLKEEPHPCPYTIQWLSQGNGLLVSSRCLVSLIVGKSYKDAIWCDLIPMDACHVLLGRPWLFDKSVTHNGRLNTYSFVLDRRKVTLTPLSPSQFQTPQKAPKSAHLSPPS